MGTTTMGTILGMNEICKEHSSHGCVRCQCLKTESIYGSIHHEEEEEESDKGQ